jgi:hypothetical protein
MTLSRTLSRLLAFGLLAISLPAQIQLTDGNLQFRTDALDPVSHLPRTMDLRCDATTTDHGFEHSWYYRVAGDLREFSFRAIGPVTSGVTPSNDHGDRDFGNVDNRNLFEASLDFDIYDTGPASGVVISRLTVMNVTNAPLTLDLFCYTDLDIANTAGDDVVSGTANSHFVTDITGVSIEVRALGSDRSAVAAYPAIRNQLTNPVVNDLSNALPPFTGDYTGAFQWQNRTLQPFEQRTFHVVMAANNTANALPIVGHYGSGNGRTFEIDSQTLLLQDNAGPRLFSVRMKGALPNAEHRVVTGFQAIPGGLPVFQNFGGNGVPLLVDPFSFIGIYFGFTDAQGQAEVLFPVPPTPYLTGLEFFHQAFYVDATAPNGFAYASAGLRTVVGRL